MERLAWELRQLRERAGAPSYRALAKSAHYSASTLAEAAKGDRLPSLAVVLSYVRACGGDQREWEARWQIASRGVARLPDAGEGAGEEDRPPYLGLAAFATEDADAFFGRSELVKDLLQRVEHHRLVCVVGASGSGKSSVLAAGLLPRLPESWHTAVFSPGAQPSQALAEAAARLVASSTAAGSTAAGSAAPKPRRELPAGPEALGITIGTWLVAQPADRCVPRGVLATSHGQLLDVRSRRVTRKALTVGETTALAFSAGGEYLAAGDESGQVTIWDGDGRRRLGQLIPSSPGGTDHTTRGIIGLAFSPGGRNLAVTTKDGMLRLWDVGSGQQMGSALPTPGGTDLAVAFTPDANTLQVSGEHVPLRTYRVTPEHVADTVCKGIKDQALPLLSKSDWAAYGGGAPYRTPC
ncbi:helix-turn-helix domain-containing protein [Streptomyces sp. NPDC023838]|uniref:nSTAND1 domain-containing NTPase n=1 Tax=Streptomyces sp. NPDC023838 TaxID=3154325 RepID=UPI0033E2AC25